MDFLIEILNGQPLDEFLRQLFVDSVFGPLRDVLSVFGDVLTLVLNPLSLFS
ncbi:MAG: hypothetical protein ACE5F9_05440 [Phycisphaerae bacterium]